MQGKFRRQPSGARGEVLSSPKHCTGILVTGQSVVSAQCFSVDYLLSPIWNVHSKPAKLVDGAQNYQGVRMLFEVE